MVVEQVAAGLVDGKEVSARDPRVKAIIAMSAPVPNKKEQWDKAYSTVVVPCFHMTGTLDDSPISGRDSLDFARHRLQDTDTHILHHEAKLSRG